MTRRRIRSLLLAPARVLLQWERRAYSGLSYDMIYERSGELFQPAMGFELRQNFSRIGDRVSYGWIPGSDSRLQRHRLSLRNNAFFRNADGLLQTLEVGPEWELETNRGHSLTLSAKHLVDDLRSAFPLSEEVVVPAGRHVFQNAGLTYSMPPGRRLRTNAGITAGSFYDGRRGTAWLSPTWNASRHLRLSGYYEFNRVNFSARLHTFTSHIGRLRMEVTPNVKYSLQAFLQYNSAGDLVVGNLRFRYNPREGNDLYLVLNEQLNTNRSAFYPRLPLSMGRTVLVKYTYTFGG